ncbi:1,2-phenylacetyl-CoA epoxidase subunit PaaD [Streptomyces rubradiris]|uniref:Phenylacetate-CoA oxygenase subunit PaaJ n=1 Tax=Streptomyces rubradiris TaxID=285531 RepID=A0ABQ3RL28_STRRR|nr:1,2-phenylacetyl-CoA epoxidase subunit PaaD [Streptomyces rubradiris]GHH10724.1 phenylacetate-CoA oxygenase subunit PaaJ [Streptomyces rubradiris]GHI56564.1 phenylacetate-CoA oxygenase subunit PaaJ [Streptomyces rubradiris]
MVTGTALEAELLELAGAVPDPELPVLTLRELGVLRAVHVHGTDAVEVDLTPTYTGCPAIEAMSVDIERVLRAHGMREVTVRTVLSPAWSTDDITPEGREKLREFGIAPPRTRRATGPVPLPLGPTRTRATATNARTATDTTTNSATSAAPSPETGTEPVRCPRCGSADTELLSRFSSTACKALRRCLSCREPFDHFKEL